MSDRGGMHVESRVLLAAAEAREIFLFFRSQLDAFAKRRIALVLLCTLLSSVLAALMPVVLKVIVDTFAGSAGWTLTSVMSLVGAYIFGQWFGRCVDELRALQHAQMERRTFRLVSMRLLHHILHLPLRYHLERQTGAVGATLSNGLMGLQMVLQSTVFTVLPLVLELGIVALVLLHLQHSRFMMIFFVALACYAIAFARAMKRIYGPAHAAAGAQVEAQAILTDSVLNTEVVKYFTAERLMQERFDRVLTRTENEWGRFFKYRASSGLLTTTIFGGFLAVTSVQAVLLVYKGQMTIGDFVLINAYMFQLLRPVEMLGLAVQQLSQGLAFVRQLMDVFREQPESQHSTTSLSVDVAHDLKFQGVSTSYRSDQATLQDVTFELRMGQTLGIVGASGAGKSTIVRLLTRILEPTKGQILLDGILSTQLSPAQVRQTIAVVPQDVMLLNDTIRGNILLGRQDATFSDIESAARVAELHEFIVRLPNGYDTQIGERGAKLSGGEKQRISIARAVLKQPRIYVFDEATSSLDSETERRITANLRALPKTSATIIIAHRLSTTVWADELIVLDKGTIVERGTHASLVNHGGHYSMLWHAQQSQKRRSFA